MHPVMLHNCLVSFQPQKAAFQFCVLYVLVSDSVSLCVVWNELQRRKISRRPADMKSHNLVSSKIAERILYTSFVNVVS